MSEVGSFASLRRAARLRRCPLCLQWRPNLCVATNRRDVPIRDKVHRSERALFDHLIGESTRVLAPPLAHGTDDRAEVATFCGEDVLGPRGTHRIEASLDDAILLKRPQTLR
jgi:hypothetical protein